MSRLTEAQPHVRVMPYGNATIASGLLPSDEVVVVVREVDYIDEDTPGLTKKQEVEAFLAKSDLLVVLDVTEIGAVLTEDDSWIDTRFGGTVRQVFRSATGRPVAAGDRLEAQASGGELKIGKVVVRAEARHPLINHRSYLLFLRNYDGVLRPVHPALVIEKGRLHYMWPNETTPLHPKPLEGVDLAYVVKTVSAARKE